MTTDKAARRRQRRARRHARIQQKVRGSVARPRLVVNRSHRNIQGQLVDDDRGVTLLGVSSVSGEVREELSDVPEQYTDRKAESFAAGRVLARKALEEGIEQVVFDRAGYPYHGRVRAFAEGARDGGLEF